MGFEIAIVISVLGISFFLVYLASQLDGKDMWLQGLKILLILMSLVFLMLNAGMNINMLDAHNQTSVTVGDDYGLENTTYLHLERNLSTNLWFVVWTFVLFMVLFIIYFINLILFKK